MEKIIVDFEDVRGRGNIVAPKSLVDFDPYHANIDTGSDVVMGVVSTVYSITYGGSSFILTVSSQFVKSSATLTVTVTVTDEDGDPVEGASVDLFKEVN